MDQKLDSGDRFPDLELTVAGKPYRVPEDLAGDYGVVLFYRGHW